MAQNAIMIVDDNPANVKLLESMLLRNGHEVRSYSLGRLALAAAEKNPPDLILLDVKMPEMDGYEVCERLKSVGELSAIPVIFLSVLNETQDKVKAFRCGAADYISKPFQLEEVHARVETQLKLYGLQRVLKAQNERLEESAADIIFRFELYPKPRFTYMNSAVTSITGYSPEEHYADPDLLLKTVHSDDHGLLENVLHGDLPKGSTVTLHCVHRNGNTVWIELRNTLVKDSDGRVIAVGGIARDITERRNLEAQLRQSQKMEAIGLLAGGVAHDFNNMLTVIIGYSDLILDDDAPGARIAEKVEQVKKAAEHSAALTRQLLAFARRQVVQRRVLNINTIVESNSEILRKSVGEDIELVITLDAGLVSIKADTGQIEQILMNLVVNAKGAMPLGGAIAIETKNIELDESRAAGITGGKPGHYVMLSVSDTGCGMDASTQARIFEPFYTTKELGRGTGLGLSIIYGIVKQSSGDIRVISEPGQGARFEILFPRCEELVEISALPSISRTTATGYDTLLVVEDEPGMRQLIGTVLRKTGYDVRIARDGNEALRICEERDGKIGLILIDMVMPGMSGPALVESLRKPYPGMRVLYMSGYAGDVVASDRGLDPGIPFIQKPFTSVSLLSKIREVLDSAPTKP